MDLELKIGKAQRTAVKDEMPEFAKESLEKEDEITSCLAAKLLALWAHGKLSASMIRELASLAVSGRCKAPRPLGHCSGRQLGPAGREHSQAAHAKVCKECCLGRSLQSKNTMP